MAKSRSKRYKCHIPAVKVKKRSSAEDNDSTDAMDTDKQSIAESVPKKAHTHIGENIFKGLNINEALKQKLPDLDARSTITSKSLKGLNLKKKDKMKMKQELWKEKIKLLKTEEKEAKLKKKRQQTPVVGDMTVIEDALPTLELLLKGNTSRKEQEEKPRSIQKEKRRKKEMLDSIALFQQVVNHPAYKDNPSATLSEHLSNKLKQEENMDS